MKIVGIGVDDHRSADHIANLESVCPYGHVCLAAEGEQGWKIPCVIWVNIICRIEMAACLREMISLTAYPFVNVETEDAA